MGRWPIINEELLREKNDNTEGNGENCRAEIWGQRKYACLENLRNRYIKSFQPFYINTSD